MGTLTELVERITDMVEIGIMILGVLLVLAYFWGVAKFLFNGNDDKSQQTGRKLLLWGTLGLVVAFSIWGLVILLQSTLYL